MGGEQAGNLADHGKLRTGRTAAQRRSKSVQERDLRRFARLISVLPGPQPLGVRSAKRCLHSGAKGAGIERRARDQGGKEIQSGAVERQGAIGRRAACHGERWGRECG
ncbi:hypothetical protein HMP09_1214 [Sphingomonas sp. HMP9]|nr:hypothetical protein HMP09_1214 [Sphingomonas sp. HMP9]